MGTNSGLVLGGASGCLMVALDAVDRALQLAAAGNKVGATEIDSEPIKKCRKDMAALVGVLEAASKVER